VADEVPDEVVAKRMKQWRERSEAVKDSVGVFERVWWRDRWGSCFREGG
jgi:hypothetical protein